MKTRREAEGIMFEEVGNSEKCRARGGNRYKLGRLVLGTRHGSTYTLVVLLLLVDGDEDHWAMVAVEEVSLPGDTVPHCGCWLGGGWVS